MTPITLQTKEPHETDTDFLARIMFKSFALIQESIVSIERRLDRIEARLDSLEKRVENLEIRMDALEHFVYDFKEEVHSQFVTVNGSIKELTYRTHLIEVHAPRG